jgi:hypothetical protein
VLASQLPQSIMRGFVATCSRLPSFISRTSPAPAGKNLVWARHNFSFSEPLQVRRETGMVDVGLGAGYSKADQIAEKNRLIDQAGIFHKLPFPIQESLQRTEPVAFISWLGHGVTEGKAAIVKLLTAEECRGIISAMSTSPDQVGVMTAERTSQLYRGRINTTRHLISDPLLAGFFFARFRSCQIFSGSSSVPFLSKLTSGPDVVAVNEKIRLVTTEEDGEHQKHADISEPSDDGLRVSRLTFQCYLNPEEYEGGQFQLYPKASDIPVNISMDAGCAVVFIQEDDELMHGGAKKGYGEPKRAIRGNLDVLFK